MAIKQEISQYEMDVEKFIQSLDKGLEDLDVMDSVETVDALKDDLVEVWEKLVDEHDEALEDQSRGGL